MLKNMFKIIQISNMIKIKEEDKNEFNVLLTDFNIKRCESAAIALLILNALLFIFVDTKVYLPLMGEVRVYAYVFYGHITESSITILWLVFLKLSRKYSKNNWDSISFYFYINFILYCCIYFGFCDLFLNGQIVSYAICILTINILICLKPVHSLIINITSLIVFIFGIHFSLKMSHCFICMQLILVLPLSSP